VRRALKFLPDTHSRFLQLLINVLPFYDDNCKRSAFSLFHVLCLTLHLFVPLLSTAILRVAAILYYAGILGSAVHILYGSSLTLLMVIVDMSNATLLHSYLGLVSDSDWHAVCFLTDIINIRDSFVNLQFSDGSTLSSHDLNNIIIVTQVLSCTVLETQ